MNNKDFDRVVKKVIENIENVLCSKAKEYASDTNRLHNFIEAAKVLRCSDVMALGGMMTKHTVSVYDIICNFEKKGELPTENLLNEKIGDLINYAILLKAMILEKIEEKQKDISEKNFCNKTGNYAMYVKEYNTLLAVLQKTMDCIEDTTDIYRNNISFSVSYEIDFIDWLKNTIQLLATAEISRNINDKGKANAEAKIKNTIEAFDNFIKGKTNEINIK